MRHWYKFTDSTTVPKRWTNWEVVESKRRPPGFATCPTPDELPSRPGGAGQTPFEGSNPMQLLGFGAARGAGRIGSPVRHCLWQYPRKGEILRMGSPNLYQKNPKDHFFRLVLDFQGESLNLQFAPASPWGYFRLYGPDVAALQ